MKKSHDQGQGRPRDLGTSSDRAMYSPSEERGRGESSERNRESDQSPPSDQSSSRDDQQYKDHQQRRDESQQQYNSGMPDGSRDSDR